MAEEPGGRTCPPDPPEFRQRMIELVRSGWTTYRSATSHKCAAVAPTPRGGGSGDGGAAAVAARGQVHLRGGADPNAL